MGRRQLSEREIRVRRRHVRECADLIEKYELEEDLPRRMIRSRLKLAGFESSIIREAVSITPKFLVRDRCVEWLQREFNGKLVPGAKVVVLGEKAGYSKMTLYRALSSIATLKKTTGIHGKKPMWKFDWITERRSFTEE